MIEIDLAVEAGRWPEESQLHSRCKAALKASLLHIDDVLSDETEVSFLFTDDAHMQALNLKWRGQDNSTNVLSFAANEGDGPATPLLGDVILAHETVEREAREQKKSFDHHLTHLLIHGFLHLLGYDHINDEDGDIMEALETRILLSLGIADPYIAESSGEL